MDDEERKIERTVSEQKKARIRLSRRYRRRPPSSQPDLNDSSAEAKAELEKDFETLDTALKTERFVFVVAFVAIFDAFVFTFYKDWAGPVCLTAIEFAGLFVLARYLEVSELVSLTIEIIRSWGKREKDPGEK